MKTLGIHTDFFRFAATEKAIGSAEVIKENIPGSLNEECAVIFISVEKEDEAGPVSVVSQLAEDTLKRVRQLGISTVVIYPYVHLTQSPASGRAALNILKGIERELSGKKLKVVRPPFGWYKSFELKCKGHPLSEWSGSYTPSAGARAAEKSEERGSKFARFVLVDLKGNAFEVTESNFESCEVFRNKERVYTYLRQFVSNELKGAVSTGDAPKHISYMRQRELVDYCSASEKGHYKWYPKGLLIQKLILDYAGIIAREWGASEIKNPILIRGDDNVVGELMGEFHERDYRVDGGRGTCYLRYASDPLGFPFMQNVRFSYKQSPLRVYEEASCFRNEQEGEVSGLKRVRAFLMTDMHSAVSTVAEAKREFETLCFKFAELMNDVIARDRWVLGWEGTISFFEENKDYLINIGKRMGVPAFFKLSSEMTHYYAIKNEYQCMTEDKSNIQVSTVQWDVKDGERFNIGYIDETGKKHPSPVIIHASSFGSVERTLCAILENIAIDINEGQPPMFPLWLAPVQARLITTGEDYLDFAMDVCERLSSQNVRVDVDDLPDTVGKKIRKGEMEWIPYLLVIGKKERDSGVLPVRSRQTGNCTGMELEAFADLVRAKTDGKPFRPLPVHRLLSKAPSFYG